MFESIAPHTSEESLTEEERAYILKKRFLPVEEADSIYFFGETDINTQALSLLGKYGICGHLFNYYGWYIGSFIPRKSLISGETLVRQSEHYLVPQKRLFLAKEFVEGSIYAMREVLRHYGEKEPAVKQPMQYMKGLANELKEQQNIPAIMGIEGNARIKYYEQFKTLIPEEFVFEKRTKNPPDNAINALISFINSLVYTAILKELYSTPLNPSVGFLHEPFERRYSLVLDISELFKPLLGDRVLLELLNNRRITLKAFDKNLNYCRLNEEGRKIVIAAFDERLRCTMKHKKLGKNVSWRQIIRLELYKILKHITNDEKYKHFRLK
jgi:CRISPR-associated protein Cas1